MFFLNLLLFTIFQIVIVYPLGASALKFLGIKLWWGAELIFGLITGIVFLTLFVFILGYTNNYSFLPLVIIFPPILLFFQLKSISLSEIKFKGVFNRDNIIVVLAISACVLIQSAIVFPNGIKPNGELRLKDVFVSDAMWQIAMVNNLQKNIPPENPIFAGEKLFNYHYFMALYITAVYKFTNIEILTLYFKLVGPFLALLLATSLYFVLEILTRNKLISAIGVVFVILSSTYYYVFGFFKPILNLNPGNFFGNDYEARMVNYHLLFSYLIITSLIYLLLNYKNIKSFKFILLMSVFIGSGFSFKSYGTILIIAALYIVGLFKIFKKEFTYLKIALLSSIFMFIMIMLLQNSKAAEGVFSFKPFWMIENLYSDPIRLHISSWEAQRNWYFEHGNYLGIAYLYLKGLAIFLFVNLGLKLLGFFSIFKARNSREKEVIIFLSVISLLGIIAPLLFIQGGVAWNTIQFFFYSSFSLGILFVILFSYLKEKIGLRLVIITMLIVWVSFLPGVYQYGKYYLSDDDNLTRYNFKGTQETYKAAKFLSSQDPGVLLMNVKYLQVAFIPAISKKDAYFADLTIISNLRIDGRERFERVESFFNDPSKDNYRKNFLKENNISYIFTAKNSLESADYLKNIYSNNEVSIYRAKL